MRDNTQRQFYQMLDFTSEMQFYDGNSLGRIFAAGCILSPLRIPFRHISMRSTLEKVSDKHPSQNQIIKRGGSLTDPTDKHSAWKELWRGAAQLFSIKQMLSWLHIDADFGKAIPSRDGEI